MYISIDLQVARVDSMWIAGKCALLNASTADTQEARSLSNIFFYLKRRCSPMATLIGYNLYIIYIYIYIDLCQYICNYVDMYVMYK